jgi:hypothetical protein
MQQTMVVESTLKRLKECSHTGIGIDAAVNTSAPDIMDVSCQTVVEVIESASSPLPSFKQPDIYSAEKAPPQETVEIFTQTSTTTTTHQSTETDTHPVFASNTEQATQTPTEATVYQSLTPNTLRLQQKSDNSSDTSFTISAKCTIQNVTSSDGVIQIPEEDTPDLRRRTVTRKGEIWDHERINDLVKHVQMLDSMLLEKKTVTGLD